MRPPKKSLVRESMRNLLLCINDYFRIPIRYTSEFVTLSSSAKARLSRFSTGRNERGEGRKSYENREGFPPTSRAYHAHLTPSQRPKQGERGSFIRSGITFDAPAYNQIHRIVLAALAFLLTLSGCGKWNARNPMVPISPTLTVGSLFTLPGDVQAIAAKNNKLYVCLKPFSPDSSTNLFYVVDASDPTNPKVIGKALDFAHYAYVYGVVLYGSFAYVDTYTKGLVVLDISAPAVPMVLASDTALATIPVGVSGSHLYGVGYGLDYLSLSDPVHPKREGRLISASVSTLVAPWDETRCAYVSYETDRIYMADFAIPASPRIVAYSSPARVDGLSFCAGSLFGVTLNSGPAALRFTWEGSDSITQTGKTYLPGNGRCLTVLGNRIVVGVFFNNAQQNLYLLSTAGPQSPYVVGECQLPLHPIQLTAEGNRIYADLGDGYLVAVEVTEH